MPSDQVTMWWMLMSSESAWPEKYVLYQYAHCTVYRSESQARFKLADRRTNVKQYAPNLPTISFRDMKSFVFADIVMSENGLKIAIYNLCG